MKALYFDMLRFEVPSVFSNVARVEALITFVICAIALLGFPYLMPILIVEGFVRGVFGHHRWLPHRLLTSGMERMGRAGKPENAGPKMFANKILFVASTAVVTFWWMGSALWHVPATLLLAFSFLEWALSFCAACWVYILCYRFFQPAGSR